MTEEYQNAGLPRKYRCLACDGPVEPVQLVCDECSYRELSLADEEQGLSWAESEEAAMTRLREYPTRETRGAAAVTPKGAATSARRKRGQPTIDALLTAIDAEVWASQRFPRQFGRHLGYIRTLGYVIDSRLARAQAEEPERPDGMGSELDRVFRKLAYE